LRQAVRAAESLPVVRRLEQALWRLKAKGRLLPKSPLGQAIDYALGQWPALEVYLGDGRVEIDNNLVENAIRPTAVGKKNWLFIGEAAAGHRSAVIYTLIESCKRRGLEPYAYLKDVLTRLPGMTNHQIKDITPAAMAAANKQTLLQAAS
jgi:transposase